MIASARLLKPSCLRFQNPHKPPAFLHFHSAADKKWLEQNDTLLNGEHQSIPLDKFAEHPLNQTDMQIPSVPS